MYEETLFYRLILAHNSASISSGGRGIKNPSTTVRLRKNIFPEFEDWLFRWEAILSQGDGPRYHFANKMMREFKELIE